MTRCLSFRIFMFESYLSPPLDAKFHHARNQVSVHLRKPGPGRGSIHIRRVSKATGTEYLGHREEASGQIQDRFPEKVTSPSGLKEHSRRVGCLSQPCQTQAFPRPQAPFLSEERLPECRDCVLLLFVSSAQSTVQENKRSSLQASQINTRLTRLPGESSLSCESGMVSFPLNSVLRSFAKEDTACLALRRLEIKPRPLSVPGSSSDHQQRWQSALKRV